MNLSNKKQLEELVKLAQTELPNRTSSFEKIVTYFRPLIYRFCLKYLRNETDAEEVCQVVFMKVFHNIEKFRGESSFQSWIYRIALNLCTDTYNKNKKKQDIINSIKAERGEELTTPAHDLAFEHKDSVDFILSQLKPGEKEVLILRFYQELKVTEIATTLGITESAAKMRLSRALEKFKEKYEDP